MKNSLRFVVLLSLLLTAYRNVNGQPATQKAIEKTWTFTYLKAINGQKDNLKTYLKKNWFAMDSIAVNRKLISRYELMENLNADAEWDFIVAVEYFTRDTYTDIEKAFEQIRAEHHSVTVNGLTLKDLGRIVRSETLQKR
ncbi:MAG: hypothetical protein JNJ75_16910 [Cyclobacteriaceae bacterium]|nr:hypothetical protein [Cyclobacteriaceae bacterium]